MVCACRLPRLLYELLFSCTVAGSRDNDWNTQHTVGLTSVVVGEVIARQYLPKV